MFGGNKKKFGVEFCESLRFDLTNNLAHSSTGVGEIMLKFDQESHLEHFMQEIGDRDV